MKAKTKPAPLPAAQQTTSAVASNPTLGYKLRVLLYDLVHVAKDPNAGRRLNATTNEHYISLPYFDEAEAAVVRTATVDVDLEEATDSLGPLSEPLILRGKSFDEAVHIILSEFINKRRASGDIRPCGPHHLAPLYASLFGVSLQEIREESFLRRLRRTGV